MTPEWNPKWTGVERHFSSEGLVFIYGLPKGAKSDPKVAQVVPKDAKIDRKGGKQLRLFVKNVPKVMKTNNNVLAKSVIFQKGGIPLMYMYIYRERERYRYTSACMEG